MTQIMGPLVSAVQRDRALDYIEKGKAEGARVVAGGGKPENWRGVLRPALNALRGRDQRHDHRARGDLRPGPGRHSVRRRR
ncbi:aldehyde dehydrogenase family protein [Sphingomonas sp. MMS24-JH45]